MVLSEPTPSVPSEHRWPDQMPQSQPTGTLMVELKSAARFGFGAGRSKRGPSRAGRGRA